MIVRGLDTNHDWLFGKGRNDYKASNDAIAQNIQTRLMSFLNDCFFDTAAGVDWWNLLGAKNRLALELAVRGVILDTEGVRSLNQLSLVLDENRLLTIRYDVTTIYSRVSGNAVVG